MYSFGLVGNCQTSALINKSGAIEWLCMPRPDSPPIFGKLLDKDAGAFSVTLRGFKNSSQEYLLNTNILVTLLSSDDGSVLKITDFCPCFEQYGRMYRPISLFRIIEPVKGNPVITIDCRVINGWEKQIVNPIRGNSHLRYEMRENRLRLCTNLALTYLCDGATISIKEPLYFAFTWSIGIEDDLKKVTLEFLEKTTSYWQKWVKHCSIPSRYQKEVIRSALALKLNCFDDTGAILAAATTSLPEEPGGTRNWDYRHSWLRDAYFVLSALHRLGHFDEMEKFLTFLLGIVHRDCANSGQLAPVYRVDQTLPLPEKSFDNWEGYAKSKPVRADNQAAEHVQNDVYGEMVLALSPIFLDERFSQLRTTEHETLLCRLVNLCASFVSQPDAGLWEYRDKWREHSFSNLMCWAGLQRAEQVAKHGYLSSLDFSKLKLSKAAAEASLRKAVVEGSIRNGPSDPSFDSALLLLPIVGFEDKQLLKKTVKDISNALYVDGSKSFLYRYLRDDDFGKPKSAFVVCSFWLVEALTKLGEKEEAERVFLETLKAANHLGLFSEHYDPINNHQLGNFPQAYAHVGLINAAFAISPPWSEII